MPGDWRTLRPRTACRPATTISTLTTIASTGRRRKTSITLISAVLGVRIQAGVRLDGVVDDDGRVVLQLERALAHHLLPGLEALADRHEVTARLTRSEER